MTHGMSGPHPSVSSKVQQYDPETRSVLEAVEKERVRQGISMMDADGGQGCYATMVKRGRGISLALFIKVLGTLGMDFVLINREGDQV